MRRRGPVTAVCALLALVLAGCGTDSSDDATAQVPAGSSAEEIEDGARWVGTTRSGATITAEAPADDDHPLVARAEEYREAADAAEVFYVVVVFEDQIDEHLPMTVQDDAYAWYADFYDHQAVGPGSVDEARLEPVS